MAAFNHLSRPVFQVTARKVGPGAATTTNNKAGILAKQIPMCIGARLMLTSSLWQPVSLCNGARGTVSDMGRASCVIMMELDKYNEPVFLTTPDNGPGQRHPLLLLA